MTFDAGAYKILIFDINNDLSNRTKDTLVSWHRIMVLILDGNSENFAQA